MVHQNNMTTLKLTSFEAARSSTQPKRQKQIVRGDDKQGRRKVWKSGGGARSTVVGIICSPDWDRLNCSANKWGGKAP